MRQRFGCESGISVVLILLGAILIFPQQSHAEPTAFGVPFNVAELNTGFSDRNPSLAADGLEVFFVSDRTGSQDLDIWYASRTSTDVLFGTPQSLAVVNTPGRDVNPCISRDGLVLYFARGWTGQTQSYDIYVATRPDRDSEFLPPVALTEVNSAGSDGNPFISADGLSLYLVYDGQLTVPTEDLYVAHRASITESFGTPTRIDELSTDLRERTPWVSSDELTMFFSSDRLEAHTYHIYETSRATQNDPWGPAQLVQGVNSAYSEGGPFYDEARQLLYFHSTRPGGQGGAVDIWAAQVVPEPLSLAFMGSAFVGAIIMRLRNRHRQQSKDRFPVCPTL